MHCRFSNPIMVVVYPDGQLPEEGQQVEGML
jgi:hypothetical protein